MEVYLCKTPEVSHETMTEVLEILNNGSKSLKFEFLPMQYNYEELPFLRKFRMNFNFSNESPWLKDKYIKELGPPLSWSEIFRTCNAVREKHQLEQDALVICLTNRRNSLNYFSMFDEHGPRNAFVQCTDWEQFIPGNPIYPIAYEVVANMLLLKAWHHIPNLNFEDYHAESIGCINDYCVNKKEIILKLRTGDICPKCLKHMLDNGVSPIILRRCLEILESIRVQLKFSHGFLGSVQPKPIEIRDGRDIFIDNNEIHLSPMEKTILIFFLKNPNGVKLSSLQDHEEEIFEIYQHIRGNAEPKKIANLVNPMKNNFSYNKSRLNRNLINKLGDELAKFYTVNGKPGEKFGVQLSDKQIRFTTSNCLKN